MTTPLLVLLVAAAVAASTASHATFDHNTARTQLLIVGPTRLDGYQRRIVAQLVPQYEEITRHAAARDLTLLERGADLAAVSDEDSHVLRRLPLPPSNYSEVLIASLGADEMSLTHIDILYQHIKTDRPLMVVEIGEPTVQLRALLKKGTACWGRSALSDNLSTHSVYLCNDVNPGTTPAIATHSIVAFDGPVKINEESFTGSIWPCMFASAAKSKKRVVESESEEEEEIIVNDDKSTEKDDDDDNENNDSKEDEDDDDKKKMRNIKEKEKLTCKYRKSCYETGKLPEITVAPSVKVYKQKANDSNETDDDDDKEDNITELKLDCKYRKSCYKERGVPQTKKDEEREAHSVLSHREVPHVGKKRTLKEIAEKTVSKVHKKEEAAAKRPLPASIIVEKKFEAMEEEMHKKLSCKYRKSCYESGDLPEIEEWSFVLPSLPLFSSFSNDDDDEKKDDVVFEKMEEEQKKFYCKYRKSCYETGQLPEIESQLETITLRNIGDLREVPTRVVSLQERCKYRKSCYETGQLPDLSVPIEKFEETAKIKEEVPTSMDALKVFCKYRKSCYAHIAEEGSVDTVKKIRKQRTVQKELQRRLRREQRRQLRDQWRLKTSDEEDEEKISRTIKDKNKKKGTGKSAMVLEPVATKVIEKAASKDKNKLDKDLESNEDDDIPVAVKVAVNKATRDNDSNEDDDDNEGDDKDESKENKKTKADSDDKGDDSEEEKDVVAAKHAHKKQGRKNVKKAPKNNEDDDDNSEKEDDYSEEDEKHNEKDTSDEDKWEERAEEKEKKKSVKKSKAAAAAARLAAEMAAEEVLHRATKKKGKKAQSKDDSDSEEDHVKKHVENNNVQKKDNDSAEEDAKEVAHKHAKKTKKEDDDSDEDVKEATATSKHGKKSEDSEEDDNGDEELTQEKKEFCKYRKSCYKSGDKPVIDEHYHSFHNTYNKEDDEEDDEKRKIVSHAHSEEERKLECKYRKSCYETGVLPEIRHLSPHQTPTSPAMGMTMELKCKYRKSCYAAEGYEKDSDDDAHVVEKEEKRKPIKEVTEEPRVEKKRVEVAREQTKQHRDKEIKMEKKVDAAAKAADEDADDDRLDVENKLSCKYRKSCYSSLPKETREDHAGNMARQHVRPAAVAAGESGALPHREKCNEYYLSCREKLGLPPKEKAPIGPNGRRLCRKRKPE